jgi:threonine 3-dehydrogenase
MRKPVVLITGANGEIGHALVANLAEKRSRAVVSLDVNTLDPQLARMVHREVTGSILAALLSSRAEFAPMAAHHVNVEGTLNLLEFAARQAESHGRPVVFVYPSSIAAYGLPDLETRRRAGPVREDDWNKPITMYGCNKLYCEQLGRYYAKHYKQLSEAVPPRVDFRCVRLPGLISAVTVPSGGTSDYASEMIHAAARGEAYTCFVRPDSRIPFMAMPDAIEALLQLSVAAAKRLSRTAYNVKAFNPSADEIRASAIRAFPNATIAYRVDARRQHIIDSWPEDVDETAARRDWDFSPSYDLDRAFHEYLIPTIRARYGL